ncbi:hypothetical protein [Paenibacillus lautus]|uniref:hypothetical protein n=1 Tax=Paenibacillus lautus TaxID=1401 RepID=UPI0013C4DBEA|nr:hypothetical protein [Paenibacillus lautus]
MDYPFKKVWDALRNDGISVTVSTEDMPKETLHKLLGGDDPQPHAVIKPIEQLP